MMEADRGAVLQALLQVLENALLAAAAQRQERWVEVIIEDNPLSLVVKDSGPGVSEEKRDLIFDPYFTTREGGDGLGLFFARRLMRATDGDLLLDATSPYFRLVAATQH
jgi:signal transduction histidine kinase